MKFTLVYDGDLPASGNKSKPVAAGRIRDVFHVQLADLWGSHVALRQIAAEARVPNIGMTEAQGSSGGFAIYGPTLPDYLSFVPRYYPDDWINLAGPIEVTESVRCIPLIRGSLYLACSLDILFLRSEEPGSLVFQGGDLDNRIKTLFDALRMPSEQELRASEKPIGDPLYCLLESDTLISGFSVKTGRLLGDGKKKPHAVRLWIDVSVEVLRVRQENLCLVTS